MEGIKEDVQRRMKTDIEKHIVKILTKIEIYKKGLKKLRIK